MRRTRDTVSCDVFFDGPQASRAPARHRSLQSTSRRKGGRVTLDLVALDRQLEGLATDDLGPAALALAARLATVAARISIEASAPREVRLLTVDEAAALGRIPRRRVFSLARSAPWAVRLGRKLLVEEVGFRNFLLDLRSDVRGEHEPARASRKLTSEAPLMPFRARQSDGAR